MTAIVRRVVLAKRPTEYEELLDRHGTRSQAQFYLEGCGQRLEDIEARHEHLHEAFALVSDAVPSDWRVAKVDRSEIDRFLFEADDIIVAVGQDGLVANVAKYLNGQPVIGINPDPNLYDGILVPHRPADARSLIMGAQQHRCAVEGRTMVEAVLDDGQRLLALNEIFVGHCSHQSARYRLRFGNIDERQSSSGMIVATGTGSTGWALSIHRSRRSAIELPHATEARLAFFVREAFPGKAFRTEVAEGTILPGEAVEVFSEMNDGGVIFGDGIESDRLEFPWASCIKVGIATERLNLVVEDVAPSLN